MMDNTKNRTIFQKQIIISNVINSIYLLLLCFIAFLDWIGIRYCWNSTSALMETVRNADADYIGGYAVVGGLFGAGVVTLFEGILCLILIVSIVYILIFLTENIHGYRIYFKLKRGEYSDKLVKGIRRNAIIKSVLALLVVAPMACLLFSTQHFAILVVIIPQLVVLLLSINAIRMLSNRQNQ